MKHRKPTQKRADVPGGQSSFRLPPDVSFSKQSLPYGWAYVFRHRTLGELGRIVLEDTGDGRTQLSLEVVGDPADPMTAERAAIFQPLGMELSQRMEAMTGPAPAGFSVTPPPRPPAPKEMIESRLIPCERCGIMLAMLRTFGLPPFIASRSWASRFFVDLYERIEAECTDTQPISCVS